MCLEPTKLYKKNSVDDEAVYNKTLNENDAAYKFYWL